MENFIKDTRVHQEIQENENNLKTFSKERKTVGFIAKKSKKKRKEKEKDPLRS